MPAARTHSASPGIIRVSAVTLVDEAGRWLTVRKRNTRYFMHPGGKPEPGESARDCAVREVEEELGLHLRAEDLHYERLYISRAANEQGWELHAEMFRAAAPGDADIAPRAEIGEIRWLDPTELDQPSPAGRDVYAPLLFDQRRAGQGRQ